MSESETADWQERARELHEEGNVPEARAEAVALVETTDLTHAEIADRLETSSGNVYNMLDKYHERNLGPSVWLAEHGPEVISGRDPREEGDD